MLIDSKAAKAIESADQQSANNVGRLLPAKIVYADLGFGRRTLGRNIKNNPDFPKAVKNNGRLYFREIEIEDYKRGLIRRAITGRADRCLMK
jgi:predicted DNA-binding transcriptional regulator AlpA